MIEDVARLAQQQISINTGALIPQESPVAGTVPVEPRSVDLEEARKIDSFCGSGCGCRLVKGGPCSLQFSKDHYATTRANAAELSWNELQKPIHLISLSKNCLHQTIMQQQQPLHLRLPLLIFMH